MRVSLNWIDKQDPHLREFVSCMSSLEYACSIGHVVRISAATFGATRHSISTPAIFLKQKLEPQ